MFPLRDDIPSQRFPVVTLMLIALNVASFLFELLLGPNLQESAVLCGQGQGLLPTAPRGGIPMVTHFQFQPKPEPGRIV